MAKLIYASICSLDGYMEDAEGNFEWAMPSEEVHAFVNELERPVGTHLYGRRMYETMVFWESAGEEPGPPDPMRDYAAIWRAADKVVYSRSLEEVKGKRTRLEREFDPAAVAEAKRAADRDLSIGGPELAGQALAAGLVDELQLFVVPTSVGAGRRALPANLRLDLELLDQRRFENGTVYLRYAILNGR